MGDTRREPIARARPRLQQHDIRERNWKICLYYDTAGTVKGSPVGSGDIVLDYTLRPKRSIANVAWTITNGSGTVTGTATAYYTTTNVAITFTGAGRITSGTGRYAGIRSLPLQFNAKHSKTGKKEAISFRGTATLPR